MAICAPPVNGYSWMVSAVWVMVICPEVASSAPGAPAESA